MIVVSTSLFGFEPATKTEPRMMKEGRFNFQSCGGETEMVGEKIPSGRSRADE